MAYPASTPFPSYYQIIAYNVSRKTSLEWRSQIGVTNDSPCASFGLLGSRLLGTIQNVKNVSLVRSHNCTESEEDARWSSGEEVGDIMEHYTPLSILLKQSHVGLDGPSSLRTLEIPLLRE